MGDSLVHKAIDLASAGYSALQWTELPPGHRAAAIYQELRRLDAAASAGAPHTARQSRNTPSEVLRLHSARPPAAPQRSPALASNGWGELRRA